LSVSGPWSTFLATSKGKPDDGDRHGGQLPNWSDRMAGLPVGRSAGSLRETAGGRFGRSTGRGSLGIVERTKTTVGRKTRHGGPKGRTQADREIGQAARSRDRRQRFSRIAQQWDLFLLRPDGVGSPARHRTDESPERVEASAETPSGFLASPMRGDDPRLTPAPLRFSRLRWGRVVSVHLCALIALIGTLEPGRMVSVHLCALIALVCTLEPVPAARR